MNEVTEWNGKPRMMWVWDDVEHAKVKRLVIHFLTSDDALRRVVAEAAHGYNVRLWYHCAEIE